MLATVRYRYLREHPEASMAARELLTAADMAAATGNAELAGQLRALAAQLAGNEEGAPVPHQPGAEELARLLELAHRVVIWTTQDTVKPDAAGSQHLTKARHEYLKARIDTMARYEKLNTRDIGGCTCGPKRLHSGKPSPDCLYHYAAALQPDNHRIPWNCPTFYDGCNCQ